MQKPDKQMDPIEEVENTLKRLTPSALSEKASRANESMIDGLAGSQPVVLKQPARRQHWWPTGIAASIMAGAGLFFGDQSKADLQGEYVYLNTTRTLEQTSDEKCISEDDGTLWNAAPYREEDIHQVKDNKNGTHIDLGRRDKGCMIKAAFKL